MHAMRVEIRSGQVPSRGQQGQGRSSRLVLPFVRATYSGSRRSQLTDRTPPSTATFFFFFWELAFSDKHEMGC